MNLFSRLATPDASSPVNDSESRATTTSSASSRKEADWVLFFFFFFDNKRKTETGFRLPKAICIMRIRRSSASSGCSSSQSPVPSSVLRQTLAPTQEWEERNEVDLRYWLSSDLCFSERSFHPSSLSVSVFVLGSSFFRPYSSVPTEPRSSALVSAYRFVVFFSFFFFFFKFQCLAY